MLVNYATYLLNTPPDIAEIVLGKSGKKLIEFISKIDLEHPEALHVLNDIFHNDNNFWKQVIETIGLTENCKNLSISSNFHKLINYKLSKSFVKNSDKFAIRLLKSKDDREVIRRQRLPQAMDLKVSLSVWNKQPANFETFNRNNIPYLEDIDALENKALRYTELGCQKIVDKVTNEIKKLKDANNQIYYGFNKITITTAAIILAKMQDCNFGNYEFGIYPSSSAVIENFDNFPDIGGKPLFDDFIGLFLKNKKVVLGIRDSKCYFIGDNNGC